MVLAHRPEPGDLEPLRALLPPRLWALFRAMPAAEQAHALRVWKGLRACGVTRNEVLMAGLLHDVGKARARLRLWERVLAVLLLAWPRIRPLVLRLPPARRAWRVAREHPEWGARLLQEAGAPVLTVRLVRHHHDVPEAFEDPEFRHYLTMLQRVDRRA